MATHDGVVCTVMIPTPLSESHIQFLEAFALGAGGTWVPGCAGLGGKALPSTVSGYDLRGDLLAPSSLARVT